VWSVRVSAKAEPIRPSILQTDAGQDRIRICTGWESPKSQGSGGLVLGGAGLDVDGMGQGEQQSLGVGPRPVPRRRALLPTKRAFALVRADYGGEPVPVAQGEHWLNPAGLEQRACPVSVVEPAVAPGGATRAECGVQGPVTS